LKETYRLDLGNVVKFYGGKIDLLEQILHEASGPGQSAMTRKSGRASSVMSSRQTINGIVFEVDAIVR
jgi:hypothetical protein